MNFSSSWLWLGIFCLGLAGFSHLLAAKSRNRLWLAAFLGILIFLTSGINASWRISSPEYLSESLDFSGQILLLSDPKPVGKAVSFKARLNIQKENTASRKITAEAWAYGSNRFRLSKALAGEWVYIEGKLSPLQKINQDLSSSSFKGDIQARLSVSHVGDYESGQIHYQIANGIRRTLKSGAKSLDEDAQALFTGIVYGDDRNQSLAQKDLFRSTGLTHILAVSGQNVAFVLAIFYPLMKHLPTSLKWPALLLILGIFLTITRFEPSVLRASAMAVAAFSSRLSPNDKRFKSSLAMAVLGIIFWNPEIIHRLAFQLSVAASAGIVFLSGSVASWLKGPGWFRLPLSITISAQLAVAPLLALKFGGVAVGSLPANMLALPAVGLTTIWGMTAGLAAGILAEAGGTGEATAEAIHLLTRFLLWWINASASFSDSLGLSWLRGWNILILIACAGTGIFLAKRRAKKYQRITSQAMAVACILLILLPAVSVRLEGATAITLHSDSESAYWKREGLLLIDSQFSASGLLLALSKQSVKKLKLAVFLEPPRTAVLESLQERYSLEQFWVPSSRYYSGAVYPEKGSVYALGGLALKILESESQIQIQICKLEEIFPHNEPIFPHNEPRRQKENDPSTEFLAADVIHWDCGAVFGKKEI